MFFRKKVYIIGRLEELKRAINIGDSDAVEKILPVISSKELERIFYNKGQRYTVLDKAEQLFKNTPFYKLDRQRIVKLLIDRSATRAPKGLPPLYPTRRQKTNKHNKGNKHNNSQKKQIRGIALNYSRRNVNKSTQHRTNQ